MTVSASGLSDSGIDRALRLALENELDRELASGELWPGEREQFPDPIPAVDLVDRPWQRPIGELRKPTSAPSLGSTASSAVRGARAADPVTFDDKLYRPVAKVEAKPDDAYEKARRAAAADKPPKKRDFTWRSERTGIVVIHGIGPQLAGQTLIDWTRPIIQLLRDAPAADPNLQVPLDSNGH
jgi:hypothetical protein